MSRVKIKFPEEKPLFTCSIPVRIGDVNYGGHVGNDAVLSVIHEARMQMLTGYGFSEMDAGGAGLIMADVAIAYKGESFYKDELHVDIYVTEFTTVAFDLLYHISTERDGKAIDIAYAKTGMVCFDYKDRKVTGVPDALKSTLKNL